MPSIFIVLMIFSMLATVPIRCGAEPGNIPLADDPGSLALADENPVGPGFAGKPVSLLTGAESFKRTDLSLGNYFPIRITRRYHSQSGYDSSLGYGWAHNYDKRIYTYPDGSVVLRKESGWKRQFAVSGGSYITPVGEYGILVKNADESFTYTLKDGTREAYDARGRLASIVKPTGAALVFSYEDIVRAPLEGLLPSNVDQSTPLAVAYDYRLTSIEEKDPEGNLTGVTVDFAYDPATGRLLGLTDSLGRNVTYDHDSVGNLTAVSGPAATASYGYADPERQHLLTTINEGEGEYVNTYDVNGRVSNQTHAGGRIIFYYPAPREKTRVVNIITDDYGNTQNAATRTVEFDMQGQVVVSTDSFGNELRLTRDERMQITRREFWGNSGPVNPPVLILRSASDFTYDERGNLLTRVDAVGPAEARTTTYTYHPRFSKVLTETVQSVVQPEQEKVTTNVYDETTGNLLSVTETGLLGDGTTYSCTTGYQYDSLGQLTRIDGPRTDVADVTSFAYDSAGNLTSVTRPLIGTTTYADFDGLGNARSVTDPNGAVTRYTYSQTGRVLTVKAPGDSQPTSYTYVNGDCGSCGSAIERVGSITLPEGTLIDYAYDAYGKLIKISDSQGNSVNYRYDSAGNRLSEEIRDAQNVLQTNLRYRYDALNRLSRMLDGTNRATDYGYDSRGNRASVKNPNGHTTGYRYDALNQLIATIQPGEIATDFGYDAQGNLSSVTDGNGNTTSYQFDDMGRVAQLISPDTGTTRYSYDEAGNLKSKTDARGITLSYRYDAAGRLTLIDYPDDPDISFTYDSCPNGKGRLCTVSDQSGATAYEYTPKGQLARETRTILGVPYVTQYRYDMNGNPISITYPSNRTVSYDYTDNRITQVRQNGSIAAIDIRYKPFGGITALTCGNGLNRALSYDRNYRITVIQTGALQKLGYQFDGNGNITAITDQLDSSQNKSYTYDDLDRLTAASGPWGSLGWSYDNVGNRQSFSEPAGSTSYSYQTGSNRIAGSSGVQTRDYSLDATGNTTRAGNQRYTYNQNNRLIEAAENNATVGSYSYNVRGQRVIKATGSSSTTVYHYDQSGLLIAESDAAGTTIAEYLYLNGQPLAKIEGGNTSYIHPDHLGTPVRMTDATGQKVWQIENRPFGDSPRITGTQDLNLRFPGQYYDQETGLHQNWHRDYQPEIGRYVEADPIGFRGGLNLFIYVQNNPTNYTDTRGLFPIYGNYCGPDWTGGYEGSWGNLTQTQRSNLHGPVDALDSCCESHDRRYETCRNTYPCDSVQRQACFEMADRELSRCANKSGAPGLGAYAVENYMKHSNPGAGKDAQKCSCP